MKNTPPFSPAEFFWDRNVNWLTRYIMYLMKAETPPRNLRVCRLGMLEYAPALTLQKETERAVLLGLRPGTLLLVEHPHTMTLGRGARGAGMVAPHEVLQARGIEVFETNRGGKVTYHGPGQLVGYPIINLSPDREDVHRYVRDLEEALIRALADFDIRGFRIKGLTGVHTTGGKIAAIGVHIARWVTTHGFALNVNTDLSFFDLIVACEGEPVVSMQRLLGRELDPRAVEERVATRFAEVFDMEIEQEGDPTLESSLPQAFSTSRVSGFSF
jgi:lipoyl(octanoyl) transferase